MPQHPRQSYSDRWELAEQADLAPRARSKSGDQLAAWIRSLRKAQLVELLFELRQEHPAIETGLERARALGSASPKEIVRTLHKEISSLARDTPFYDGWDTTHLPDYSGVQRGFNRLLAEGHYDELLQLARVLFEEGSYQIGHSQDDGMIGMEITECLDVALKAVPSCSLPASEQLLFLIRLQLEDQYGLVGSVDEHLDAIADETAWMAVAEELLAQLGRLAPAPNSDFTSRYQRDQLTDWIVRALDEAHLEDAALELLESEADVTGSYVRLVKRLVEAGRPEEARAWAQRGIAHLPSTQRGAISHLVTFLAEIARSHRQPKLTAAYAAESFFEHPELAQLETLLARATEADCEAQVRKAALAFLKTGDLPLDDPAWPLPKGTWQFLQEPDTPRNLRRNAPEIRWTTLCNLALAEDRPSDALHWHDQLATLKTKWFRPTTSNARRVALAVAKTHPKRALEILLGVVEAQVSQKKRSGYEAAGKTLLEVRALFDSQGRSAEWPAFIAQVREPHKRKPLLMQVLDSLNP